MPHHGPHTTPRMTDAHREALFREGTCPYCNTANVTSETKQVKMQNNKWYDETKYTCCTCGAEGTFRKRGTTAGGW